MSGDDTSSRYKYSWFRPAGCILFEMEAKFELPDLLRQYVVSNVRQTGRELGKGAYGSVVEVEIPGAVCAAKKVHETLTRLSSEAELRRLARKFVEECQLMSSLRHPHVVQFLGVCFFPGSWLPFLLMERMLTSLSQLLETNPTIPLAIKRSILCDVARGLLYLHSQTPPIAHRDLTAKNILLNSTMVAKIADLGVARILNIDPGQLSSSMTQAPGATVYMSPEALEPNPRYNTSLDIFSFGNVAMYTLTQEFPQLKAPTFLDSRGRIKGRTEIERRVDHIQQIYQQLGKQHPLAQLTVQCLHNDPRQRPPVEKVLLKLEELKEHIPDVYGHMTSMEMMKLLAEKGGENQILRKQLEQTRKDFNSAVIEDLRCKVQRLELQNSKLQQQLSYEQPSAKMKAATTHLSVSNISETRSLLLARRSLPEPPFPGISPNTSPRGSPNTSPRISSTSPRGSPNTSPRLPRRRSPAELWRSKLSLVLSQDMPFAMSDAQAAIIDDDLYIGGAYSDRIEDEHTVLVYAPASKEWSQLRICPVHHFAMTAVGGKLMIAGGESTTNGISSHVMVWDYSYRQWILPYPPMPTARVGAAAIGYAQFLILAGGYSEDKTLLESIEFLDTLRSQWYTAIPLPLKCFRPVTALSGDTMFLLGGGTTLSVNLPCLLYQATSRNLPKAPIQHRLVDTALEFSAAVVVQDSLIAVGGKDGGRPSPDIHLYDDGKEWTKVGELPAARSCSTAVGMPSGNTFAVIGGYTMNDNRSNKLYIMTFHGQK